MSFHRAAALAALLVISRVAQASQPAPPPPEAQAGSLRYTLDTALAEFRARGFDLLIADAAVANAQGDVTIAGAIQNPQFAASIGRAFHYDASQCAGCSAIALSTSVTDQAALSDALFGKRKLRVAVARAALDVAKRSRADVERTLEFTVKQQVLQAELAKQSLAYAAEAQSLANETLRLVRIRYHAGAISEADVARAEVQTLEADQAADLARQNFDAARAGLAYLLGYKETPADLDVGDDLTRTAPRDFTAATAASFLQTALANRPDLQAARSQVERAQSSIALAQRLRIPDLFPTLTYTQQGTGQNALQPPTVTAGVAFAPPLLYDYRGELAKARADLRTQELTSQKIEAQIGADVTAAFTAFTSAQSRVTRGEGELLARAGRARDLVKLQYEKGAASLFEFLDAQRTFLAARSESLQALNDYWTAVFQLEQATATEIHR